MKPVAIIHGPNLNSLGKREPKIYGSMSLAELDRKLVEEGKALKLLVSHFQSNHEGELIDQIQSLEPKIKGLIINPGGLTHTSVSIRDALSTLSIPRIEVHISNIYARERFRRRSLISAVCSGSISGFGVDSYSLALSALARLL